MCGRLTVKTPASEIAREFGALTVLSGLERPRYNLAPSQEVPVIANTSRTELDLFRWGLVPSWAKDAKIGYKLTNARAESLAERATFRTPLQKRRCVLLVDGFFEWRKDGKNKVPVLFRRSDGRPFALAGLWDQWSPPGEAHLLRTCTVVTTAANGVMAPVHDRMPVILSPEGLEQWLRPEKLDPAELSPLLVPCPDSWLTAHEVSKVVNNARNDVPECLLPIGHPELSVNLGV